MKKVGIMGGSYNPPHIGHINSAREFYDFCKLDELIVVPAGDPPHKTISNKNYSKHRLEMCKLSFGKSTMGVRNVTVSDYEIQKEGKSYTFETLEHFKNENTDLFFFCGEDMFITLDTWKNPDRIFKTARPVCIRRSFDKQVENNIQTKKNEFLLTYGVDALICNTTPIEMSSTAVKNAAKESLSLLSMVTPDVAEYIENNGLYGTEASLIKLKAIIEPIVGERFNHILATEKECLFLANVLHLENVFELRVAALLHDITHHYDTNWHIDYLKSHNVNCDIEYINSPPTLHSQSGSIWAKANYPKIVTDSVCDMISSHTVGYPDMPLPNKILCLSDYIEETRAYDSCVLLREYVHESITEKNAIEIIDKALLIYFKNTYDHLIRKKQYVNKIMIETMEELESYININYIKTNS